MATLSVSSGSYMRPYRAGRTRIHNLPTETAATFVRGAVVIESADTAQKGRIKLAGADPTAIFGVAAEGAPGNNTTAIPIWVADPSVEFVAHVESGATPAADGIGLECGIVEDTTNAIWRVDLSDTTNTRVKIVEVLDPGDTNGRVVFKFLSAAVGLFR